MNALNYTWIPDSPTEPTAKAARLKQQAAAWARMEQPLRENSQ